MVLHKGKYEELIVCSHEIAASTAQLVAASKVSHTPGHSPAPMLGLVLGSATAQDCKLKACLTSPQVKANKHSPHLSRLQECSRTVNERAANVVASTKSGQEQIEDRGEHLGVGGLLASGLGRSGHPDTCPLPLATDTMDFSGMSLIKLKKQEMETQVGSHGATSGRVPGTGRQC